MKCPACNNRAVSFLQWGHGLVAFRYTCPHCGKELRASQSTIAWFVFMLCLIPVYIFVGERVSDYLHIEAESQRRLVFGAIVVPSILGISYFIWRFGRY
jgi:hypothetical protein